jgi:dynein heavy chain, axonemal
LTGRAAECGDQVFQGVILASRDRFQKNSPLLSQPMGGHVTSPEGYLLALWIHECHRVFCDKLITLQDKEWVENTIRDICR